MQRRFGRLDRCVLIPILLVHTILAADKPSPFAVRKSEAEIPVAAPVAPVSPMRVSKPKLPPGNSVAAPAVVIAAPMMGGPVQVVRPVIAVPAALMQHRPEPAAAVAPAMMAPPATAATEPVRATPPQLEEIAVGDTREQVSAKLGKPATSISMYEDSGFVESLRYEWKGAWAGTVRLNGGKVIRVDRPQ